MDDYIARVSIDGGAARGFFAVTRQTVNAASAIHRPAPPVAAALGRLLTAGAMMGCMMKNERDVLSLIVKGDGPVGGLVVTADAGGNVKGYAHNPAADAPSRPDGKLDVAVVVGAGTLRVVKDLGLKEPYTGEVALQSGEIAEDIAYYFTQSEQTPSAVALGVLIDRDHTVKHAGGFIIQMTPGAPDWLADELQERLAALPGVTALMADGQTPEDIAETLLRGLDYEITDKLPVAYRCDCSRERVLAAVSTIGRDELTRIIAEDGQIAAHCHFCGKDYAFGAEILTEGDD